MPIIPLKGTAFDNFINSLEADKTKNEYQRNLLEFARWRMVKSIDQLLIGDAIELKTHITKYLTYLRKEKGLSSGTINIACTALRHFFIQNDVSLNWDIIRKFIVREDVKKNQDKEYSYEEVTKVLSLTDLKSKVIIYLMVSAGVRIGSLHTMNVGDLEKMPHHEIYKITVYRGSRDEYFTFCTPECFHAVNNYLDFRRKSGEIVTGESVLFRTDFDPRDKQQVLNPKRISYDAIKSKVRSLLIRSGVADYKPVDKQNLPGRRRNTSMASHAFRKTFYTNAARSRMKSEVLELIMGHKIGLRASYLRYSVEDMLNEYLRAVDNLTIDASNRLLAQVDEFKKQERDIQELRKQIDFLQKKDETYSSLVDRIAELVEADKGLISLHPDSKDRRRTIELSDRISKANKERKRLEQLVKGAGKDIMKKIK